MHIAMQLLILMKMLVLQIVFVPKESVHASINWFHPLAWNSMSMAVKVAVKRMANEAHLINKKTI